MYLKREERKFKKVYKNEENQPSTNLHQISAQTHTQTDAGTYTEHQLQHRRCCCKKR